MKLSIDVKKKWDGNIFSLTIIPKIEHRSIREAALFCQGQAILLSPVKDGRLRGSICVKIGGKAIIKNQYSGKSLPDDFIQDEPQPNTAHVGTNCVYATVQEFGGTIEARLSKFLRFKTEDGTWHTVKSVNIPAQPYLRPAADLTEGKSVTIIEQGGRSEFENYRGIT